MINWLAKILGYVLSWIYDFFALFTEDHTANIGLCIITFTFVVRMLMLPMTIKQQKFSKLTAIMNPEIQAIQKKYQNRKDQQSQLEQQEEIRAVYDKYGTSPTGSCLQLIIQMPILFAVYRVVNVSNISKYVTAAKDAGDGIYKFFIYNDIRFAPSKQELNVFYVWLIPVLAGLFQFLSVQLTTKLNSNNNNNNQDNPMAGSMKMMNWMMPLLSVWMCYSLPTGLGLYWVAGSLIMMLQQLFINIYMNRVDVNEIIEKNKEKAAAKAEKRKAKEGIYREQVLKASKVNTKNISSNSQMSSSEREEIIRKAKESASRGGNSIASKANLVSDYNKRNEK